MAGHRPSATGRLAAARWRAEDHPGHQLGAVGRDHAPVAARERRDRGSRASPGTDQLLDRRGEDVGAGDAEEAPIVEQRRRQRERVLVRADVVDVRAGDVPLPGPVRLAVPLGRRVVVELGRVGVEVDLKLFERRARASATTTRSTAARPRARPEPSRPPRRRRSRRGASGAPRPPNADRGGRGAASAARPGQLLDDRQRRFPQPLDRREHLLHRPRDVGQQPLLSAASRSASACPSRSAQLEPVLHEPLGLRVDVAPGEVARALAVVAPRSRRSARRARRSPPSTSCAAAQRQPQQVPDLRPQRDLLARQPR